MITRRLKRNQRNQHWKLLAGWIMAVWSGVGKQIQLWPSEDYQRQKSCFLCALPRLLSKFHMLSVAGPRFKVLFTKGRVCTYCGTLGPVCIWWCFCLLLPCVVVFGCFLNFSVQTYPLMIYNAALIRGVRRTSGVVLLSIFTARELILADVFSRRNTSELYEQTARLRCDLLDYINAFCFGGYIPVKKITIRFGADLLDSAAIDQYKSVMYLVSCPFPLLYFSIFFGLRYWVTLNRMDVRGDKSHWLLAKLLASGIIVFENYFLWKQFIEPEQAESEGLYKYLIHFTRRLALFCPNMGQIPSV